MLEMIFNTNARFFLTATVMVSLVKVGKMNVNCNLENSTYTSGERPNAASVVNETWQWVTENKTSPWDKLHQVNGATPQNDEQETNWCMHVGVPIQDVNFSRFRLTNECCEKHIKSVLVEINNTLGYKCKDEDLFYDCLKRVNSAMSRRIGSHYFKKNKNNTNTCYEIKEEEYCFNLGNRGEHCPSVILTISARALKDF